MKKSFLIFFLLIATINVQSQIKAPIINVISFNISTQNINGKEHYYRAEDNYVFDGKCEILLRKKDLDYTSANHLMGIPTGFKEKGRFEKGFKDGNWKTTYKKKIVKIENWNNGLIKGEYKVYNINRELLYETNFGKEGTGKYKDYDYKSGELKVEGSYINGKREREWCDYDENGNIKTTVYFKNGTPIKK